MRFFAVLAITAAVSLTKGDKTQLQAKGGDDTTADDDTKKMGPKGGKDDSDDADTKM